MNSLKLTALLMVLVISQSAWAGTIQNGNFSTCDFSGWQKDTDGVGDISAGNDFYIDGSGSNCRAAIEVDFFDTAGDPYSTPLDDAWLVNTLSQELDFTGGAGSVFQLNLDFEVISEASSQAPSFIPDSFLIGIHDGLGNYYDADGAFGFLVSSTDIDGIYANNLTFELDSSFTNTSGWFLEFQLYVGANSFDEVDGFGSTLFINNASLAEQPVDVPEPSTLIIFSLAMLAIKTRNKLYINKEVRL